ncbi:hypothetical protein [Pseudomonas huanghezhanensis]|uniref:hypothetical protein n=1 Tax=Pseudomonas huanghezhanensis TaxID=3002903 RepID=UPI002286B25A|nr:hypothetical protein [Pseudomonas sp. BSw22131]
MCNSRNPRLLITRPRKSKPRDLNPPTIPLADPIDGLLTLEDLQQQVTLSLTVWDDALPGDTYKLRWNNEPTNVFKSIADDELPGDLLSLVIPASLLVDGVHQAGYTARSSDGGQEGESPDTPVIVDRTAPGGDLLAALVFPAVTQDGMLTSEELKALGNVLTAEVPGYTGIAWGDQIRSFWGAVPGPEHTVIEEEVTMNRVMLNFSRAFLESLGDVTDPVYYTVTDRAGNESIHSLPKRFRLFLRDVPQDFPAPLCAQADDSVIDDSDARAAVLVEIPHYPDAQPGDKVMLYWGETAMPEATLLSGDETQNPMLGINVRYAIIALPGDGPVSLRYEARRNGVLIGSSLLLDVNVYLELPGPQDPDPETPENEALALPVIKGSSDNANNEDNVIDEDDFLLEAHATVQWNDEFAVSDVIRLYWGSQTAPVVFPIKSTDLNKDLVLTIPNQLMANEGSGALIKVFYTVTHNGNPNTSRSAEQGVVVNAKGDLPGGVDGLAAPIFSNANANNAISPILSPDGTPIKIMPYEHIDKYPRVTLVFHGYNAANGNVPVPGASLEETHVLDEFEMISGYSFRVSDRQLRLICTGRAEAYYRVEGPNGPVNSKTAPVLIRMATPGQGC